MTAIRVFTGKATAQSLQSELTEHGYVFFPETPDGHPEALLSLFGDRRPQEDGQAYYTVKAGEFLQPEDGGALMPHTDEFNVPLPPRLVSLHCIRPDQEGFGQTLIADGFSWMRSLSSHQYELLQKDWNYRNHGGEVAHPFLAGRETSPMLRVSFGHLRYQHHAEMCGIMSNLSDWFAIHAKPVTHRAGSLFVWDNWRMVHGRNSYQDLRRELHRYYLD